MKHSSTPSIYECTICKQQCNSTKEIKRHCIIHTNFQPYKCRYCDRGFSQKGNHDKHVQRIHITERKYKCKYCCEMFIGQYDKSNHMNKEH